ncbi:MAG: hypothetical protein GXO79_10440 [Chlorobi bacterium]|nr:hypothetical protein [Chlorobiota bacterium]
MGIDITINYTQLFKEKVPDFKEVSKNIPSIQIIKFLSLINNVLWKDGSLDSQISLLKMFISRTDKKFKKQVLDNLTIALLNNSQDGNETNIFNSVHTTDYIFYELNNFRELEYTDLTPEIELNLLKSIFSFNKTQDEIWEKTQTKDVINEVDFFRKNMWPIVFKQFTFSYKKDFFNESIKGLALLNYFDNNDEHKVYSNNFKKKIKGKTYLQYIENHFKFLMFILTDEENPFKNIIFKLENNHFLRDYSLDIDIYKKGNKFDVNILKDKPIIEVWENHFMILNYNFLQNKLFEGLIFEFYNKSGISKKYKNKPDFFNVIGNNVIEKTLFRILLSYIFNLKHIKIVFDNENGFPDAYVRVNNNIFIFEIKHAFFPIDAITSFSFKKITSVIDEKYNTAKKGTGQLIKYINDVDSFIYEKELKTQTKIKSRNFNIFPILIYTDHHFSVPSVGKYLEEEFEAKISKTDFKNRFKKVHKLSFINLDFFIENLDLLKNEKNLNILIQNYHYSINKIQKKLDKTRDINLHFSVNDNFETITKEYIQENPKLKKYKYEDNIKPIINGLNLNAN